MRWLDGITDSIDMPLLLGRISRVQLYANPQTAAPRLPRPWDSPGENTGVGCHFLLHCMKVKSESEVAQSCLFEQTQGDSAGQGRLACCSSWGCKELDTTYGLNNNRKQTVWKSSLLKFLLQFILLKCYKIFHHISPSRGLLETNYSLAAFLFPFTCRLRLHQTYSTGRLQQYYLSV